MKRSPTLAVSEQASLQAEVLRRPLPRHVAIIMDGNGRWAEGSGQPRSAGHREGSAAVREVTRVARRLGIPYLTLYAFSAQNWLRPVEEVQALMALLAEYLVSERNELLENQIRLRTIGETERLPDFVREPLLDLIQMTRHNGGMTLTLALSYGGREEIVRASRHLAEEVEAGVLRACDVTESLFRERLWTSDMPDPDLVIRTSGELRLSNFLLFQLAYAEIVPTEVPWPAFRERELLLALRTFQTRKRRFGQLPASPRGA